MGTAAEPDYWPRLAVRESDWKLMLTEDGKRVELHHLSRDRTETEDVSKDHPDIVARLSQMALEWKATLPAKPNPECLSKQTLPAKPTPAKPGAKSPKVTPEVRAKAFARWDTNRDDILTLEEYQTGLKGQSDLESRYKSFDQNGDGKLTRAEFIGK
jgi:hypothetical protein